MSKPKVIWIYGLPASGKTSVADIVKRFFNIPVIHLDGDEVRETVSKRLGYDEVDRYINISNIMEMTSLLLKKTHPQPTIVVSAVTPYRRMREDIIDRFGDDVHFVFLYCPLNILLSREIKNSVMSTRKIFEFPDDEELAWKNLSTLKTDFFNVENLKESIRSRFYHQFTRG